MQLTLLKTALSVSPFHSKIANIGPADYNSDESLNTLRYANRAKNIQNSARINEDPKDAMLREFQKEIETLKQKLTEGMQFLCATFGYTAAPTCTLLCAFALSLVNHHIIVMQLVVVRARVVEMMKSQLNSQRRGDSAERVSVDRARIKKIGIEM